MSFSFQNKPSSDQGGFTLLEVLISVFLLVIISLSIYQATGQAFRLREVLANQGEFYNGIRLTMDLLGKDISLIYNPLILLPQKDQTPALPGQPRPTPTQDVELQELMNSDQGRTTQFWLGATDKTGVRGTHFIGTENKISFVALSHIRVYKDAPESEFAKIVYELQEDKNPDPDVGGKILVKTTSPNAFEEDETKDKQTRTYPLLRGVQKLQFKYWRQDKKEYVTTWDNDKEDLREKYPDWVEIILEVKGPSRMFFEGLFRYRPEIPLRAIDPSF